MAIVTGGTRGIGAAIAKRLKEAGYAVAATYHGNDEAAAKFKAETGASTYKWDVADPEASAEGVKQVEAELGPVDVLVNNAGITRDGMFHKMTFDAVVGGAAHQPRFDVRHDPAGDRRACASAGAGRIVNISSINGQKGQMGQTNYSAAKAGVIGFTKALAQENASKGVTVNCICPGYIDTEMVQAVPEKVLEGDHRPDPGRPARQGRGDRLAGRLARLRRRRLHDRRGADHQRRPVHRQRIGVQGIEQARDRPHQLR